MSGTHLLGRNCQLFGVAQQLMETFDIMLIEKCFERYSPGSTGKRYGFLSIGAKFVEPIRDSMIYGRFTIGWLILN